VVRSPGGYAAVVGLYTPILLFTDAYGPRWAQTVGAVVTWALLAVVWLAVVRRERRQLVAVVCVATTIEILCSIVWGLYVYRFDNLPLYVPAGHGLIYLLALRLAATGPFGTPRATRLAALAVSAWAAGGLVLADRPDLAGAMLVPILLVCLLAGPHDRRRVYVGAFVATASLEIVGTAFGNWAWQPTVPGTWFEIGMGNPPSAIAAGYCALDMTVLALTGWYAGWHRRRSDQAGQPSSPGRIGRPAALNARPESVHVVSMPALASASAAAAAAGPDSTVQVSSFGGSTSSTGHGFI
jgi:hypothetical protein